MSGFTQFATQPTFLPAPNDGHKYAQIIPDGIDYSFHYFEPERDLIFGPVVTKDTPPSPEGVTGVQHTIALTRRYPNGTTGPFKMDGPRETAPMGLSDPVALAAAKAKKKNGGKEPPKKVLPPPAPGEEVKANLPKRSILSKFDKKNPEHLAYIAKWRQIYVCVVRHLCKDDVRDLVGMTSLDPEMIPWDKLNYDKPCGSLLYPVHYPRDDKKKLIEGADPSMFYKVNTSPGYFGTQFMLPSNPPRLIDYDILEECSFDFIGQYNFYDIYITKGVGQFRSSVVAAAIGDMKPRGKAASMGNAITKLMQENPNIMSSLDAQIASIQGQKLNDLNVNANIDKLPQGGANRSTTAGLPGGQPQVSEPPPGTFNNSAQIDILGIGTSS